MSLGINDGSLILRSPREASSIYNLAGAKGPRQHNAFAVCFHKAGTTAATAGTWQKDISFLIKNVDRPSIEPKLEEVNQYNKKRLIQTGYKIGPTRMTIYDTADSMAMRMMAEYSKYYFGDFRHLGAATDWNSDITSNTFNGSALGYGFAPQAAGTAANEFNQQFFFDSISVYQVYGGKFVQYDLIKPKIASFNPDELDYSNAEAATITLTIQCEAILYINDFQPQPISADAFLTEAFGNPTEFEGDTIDYPANDSTDPSTASNYAVFDQANYIVPPVGFASQPVPVLQTADTGVSSGSLAAYGQYNFGSTSAGVYSVVPAQSLSSDLSRAALTNPLLATSLTATATLAGTNPTFAVPSVGVGAITQAIVDEAMTAVQATALQSGAIPSSDFATALAYGAISAGAASGYSPREMIFNRAVPDLPAAYAVTNAAGVRQYGGASAVAADPIAAITGDGLVVATAQPGQVLNTWNSAAGQGVSLSPYAYGVVNAQRSPCAQIGFNARTTTPYQNRFGQNDPTTPRGY